MYRFAIFSVLALVCGCSGSDGGGPRLYTVSGMVTYSSEPLLEADLVVRTVDGKYAAGSKIRDGKFTLKAPAGSSIVEITALQDVPGAPFREENPGERVPVREQFIPAVYNTESTLKIEVQGNTNDANFDLMPSADQVAADLPGTEDMKPDVTP